MKGTSPMRLFLVVGFPTALLAAVAPLEAGLIGVNIFVNTAYRQTSGSPPVLPDGYFFGAGGGTASPSDFDSASVTYPGPGSPQALAFNGTTFFGFGSPLITSLATFQSEYPFGTYTINAQNSVTLASESGVINYSQDAFTTDIPALTAVTYEGLQGMNPAAGMTISFNAFTPNPLTDLAFVFFNIFDGSNIVFGQGFLAPSTTSVFLPANTLLPNHFYQFELNFDNRLEGFDNANNVFAEQGFDVRTSGSFTTGSNVPEPGTVGLVALGLGGLGLLKRSRQGKLLPPR